MSTPHDWTIVPSETIVAVRGCRRLCAGQRWCGGRVTPVASAPARARTARAADARGSFAITERAESGPITAIAVRPPFLWAAGAGGLRRCRRRRPATTKRSASAERPRRARRHRHRDRRRGRRVGRAAPTGSAAGSPPATNFATRRKGTPGTVTALVARRPVATRRHLGRRPGRPAIATTAASSPASTALHDVAVTSLALDDDGKGVWVGTRGRGLYRADGDRAAPVPGGEAILLDDVGRRQDRRRDARRRRQRRAPRRACTR